MRKIREKGMAAVFAFLASISIIAVLVICIFLFARGIPAIHQIGFTKFVSGKIWKPGSFCSIIQPISTGGRKYAIQKKNRAQMRLLHPWHGSGGRRDSVHEKRGASAGEQMLFLPVRPL